MVELLAPVGNLECLKAAVQNGADAVYFGVNSFSARAFADNFDFDELQQAISYAKIRGVKTNLTLNTLIKQSELPDAFQIGKMAYELGIDAIIVQDLGLARLFIQAFPDLPIHASTQMSIHNLRGVLKLQELGFKRIVLSRELSLTEIHYICQNSRVEIECFVHGALCISYSGQCLFSSMIGGRSGNRGKCAQPCRLPYSLLEDHKKIDQGYLLSPRDLCGLPYLPELIQAGVTSFKIEGRMKSPEYVATVTRIYRKYIDLSLTKRDFIIDKNDQKDLLQVFNRGGFSSGHLETSPNQDLIDQYKSNHMGLFAGKVQKHNQTKGLITLKLQEQLEIGDCVSFEKEPTTYSISELMENKENIKTGTISHLVTIGRMKGNIHIGDKIYKTNSKQLTQQAHQSYQKESRKIPLSCLVKIKKGEPISLTITSACHLPLYKNLKITCDLNDVIPVSALQHPLLPENVILSMTKTNSTPYYFPKIDLDLDDDAFIPKISSLNQLRRLALAKVEQVITEKMQRKITNEIPPLLIKDSHEKKQIKIPKTAVLLRILHLTYDYSQLENIDIIYIPLKYFSMKQYEPIIQQLSTRFSTYIYMPSIIKANYANLFSSTSHSAMEKYHIKGFVISNICNIELLNHTFEEHEQKQFDLIANYTFNSFNLQTVEELKKLGIGRFTISPELDKNSILPLLQQDFLETEMILYGQIPLMNMNYCLLGKTNKCYPKCQARCNSQHIYELQDRINMKFPILPDNIQTVTTVFNSKITSICPPSANLDCARIDVLAESIEQINTIIKTVKSGKRLEGTLYTSGNSNREI